MNDLMQTINYHTDELQQCHHHQPQQAMSAAVSSDQDGVTDDWKTSLITDL